MRTPTPEGMGADRQDRNTGTPIVSRLRSRTQRVDELGRPLSTRRYEIPDAPRLATPSWHGLARDRWVELSS
jgi:hypothetical protein